MLNRSINFKSGTFSFSDYFKMNIEVDELLAQFNYSFKKDWIFRDKDIKSDQNIESLKKDLDMLFESIDFNSEMAIREFLISPILIFLLKHYKFKLKSEKNIYFNEQLKGVLDYYIESSISLVVVEAKYKDLNNGLKQLAMELIAMDSLIDDKNRDIYGVVTIGTDWIFVKVDRANKIIIKDKKIVRVPEELDKLLGIFSFIIDEKE